VGQGIAHAEGGRADREESQGSERPVRLPRSGVVQHVRQHDHERTGVCRRAARELPDLHGSAVGSARLLPLLAVRRLRERRLACVAQPQPRVRHPQPAVVRGSQCQRRASGGAAREHEFPAALQGLLQQPDAPVGLRFPLQRAAAVPVAASGRLQVDRQLHARLREGQRERQYRQPRGFQRQGFQLGAQLVRSPSHLRGHVDVVAAVLQRADTTPRCGRSVAA
jgi:hypothetical protein